VDQLDREAGELLAGPRAPLADDQVARLQRRPQPPRPAAPDIAGLHTVRPRQRPHNSPVLAMRADREDDRVSAEVQRRPGGDYFA
jgi:hypothetical protein